MIDSQTIEILLFALILVALFILRLDFLHNAKRIEELDKDNEFLFNKMERLNSYVEACYEQTSKRLSTLTELAAKQHDEQRKDE